MESNLNKCTYCDKEFARERTLQVHLCEPKRRHLQKNEKWVQNAFMVFQRFYEIHQNNSKPKTYNDFSKPQYLHQLGEHAHELNKHAKTVFVR